MSATSARPIARGSIPQCERNRRSSIAMNALGVSGLRRAISTGASLIAPRCAIGLPSALTSSIAGSLSGSSARPSGALTISHNRVTRNNAPAIMNPIRQRWRRRGGAGAGGTGGGNAIASGSTSTSAPSRCQIPGSSAIRFLYEPGGPRQCLSPLKQSAANIQRLMNPALRLGWRRWLVLPCPALR